MSGKRLPSCRHCGRKFHPDPYNRHHQECCGFAECKAAVDRERKRRYYRRRLEREKGFRESERRRCRDAMRSLRRARREACSAVPAPASRSLPPADQMLAGLVSQLADTTDRQLVFELMNSYADRGRQLAVPVPVCGSSP
jgi:hypothetical protein